MREEEAENDLGGTLVFNEKNRKKSMRKSNKEGWRELWDKGITNGKEGEILKKEQVVKNAGFFKDVKKKVTLVWPICPLKGSQEFMGKKKNFCVQNSAIEGKVIDKLFSKNFLEKIKNVESSDIYRRII